MQQPCRAEQVRAWHETENCLRAVVGGKAVRAGKVNLRIRGNETAEDMSAAEFVEKN
jgi:threonyl-tRNA synthetase